MEDINIFYRNDGSDEPKKGFIRQIFYQSTCVALLDLVNRYKKKNSLVRDSRDVGDHCLTNGKEQEEEEEECDSENFENDCENVVDDCNVKQPSPSPIYNCNLITKDELENRTSNSKPIYFDHNFIRSSYILAKISIENITPKMVQEFLNRDHPKYDRSTKVAAEAHRETVLRSIDHIKSFFRSKGCDLARMKVTQYYNEHLLEQGTDAVNSIRDIANREHDMNKVSLIMFHSIQM